MGNSSVLKVDKEEDNDKKDKDQAKEKGKSSQTTPNWGKSGHSRVEMYSRRCNKTIGVSLLNHTALIQGESMEFDCDSVERSFFK